VVGVEEVEAVATSNSGPETRAVMAAEEGIRMAGPGMAVVEVSVVVQVVEVAGGHLRPRPVIHTGEEEAAPDILTIIALGNVRVQNCSLLIIHSHLRTNRNSGRVQVTRPAFTPQKSIVVT
jgi:hypothetical protein